MAKAKPGRDGNPLELHPARGHERAGKSEATVRNVREHPMDILLARETIEAFHHEAAERFLRDWELSEIGSARAASLEPRIDGSRCGDLSAAQADAMSRVNAATESLGRTGALIVTSLVVGRQNLDQIGASVRAHGRDWPPKRYGGPRICEALHDLAEHYGLITRAQRRA